MNTTERDELYEAVLSILDGELGIRVNQSDLESTADTIADAILDAGYTKPRTVTREMLPVPREMLRILHYRAIMSGGQDALFAVRKAIAGAAELLEATR